MREIKFRAWDVKNKIMVYHGAFQFEQYPDVGLRPEQLKPLVFPFEGIESGDMITESPLDAWHTMQFTGLKDKNGKEIYEGDICITLMEYFDECEDGDFNFTVEFENGSFWNWPEDLTPDKCEVIGNTFENPELQDDNH